MRFNEFNILIESRGVTARTAGEQYVNQADPTDILTIQKIEPIAPQGAAGFETVEELASAIKDRIPANVVTVDDNKPNASTKAAVLAVVTDQSGTEQYWVRYLRQIPATGLNGTWATLRGYKLNTKKSESESIPIKPADIILDDNFRTAEQLASEIKKGIYNQVNGTAHQELSDIINIAVDHAYQGIVSPIPNGAKYATIIEKYAGEYLGPLSAIQGGVQRGDISKMLSTFNLKSLSGSTISFPTNKTNELIDSNIQVPNGVTIQVSTKMKKSGGAASSLSGVAKQLTPEITAKFPRGSEVIKILGTESFIDGPFKVAIMYNLLSEQDLVAFSNMDKSSRNINDLGSRKLISLTQKQGVQAGTFERPEYRVFFHALTAVVNALTPLVNKDKEFIDAMLAALNNNNYLQLLTIGKKQGNNLLIDYDSKFPAVFVGTAQLVNKTYFATGQKGRIGFKLK